MIAPEPAEDAAEAPQRSILNTWADLLFGIGGLIHAEARLIRAETSANFQGAGRNVLLLAAGGLLLLVALVFLAVAAVMALATVTGMLWALALVAIACLIIGIVLIRNAQRRLERQSFLPERALARMAADLDRMTERVDAPPPLPYEDPHATSPEAQ